MRKFLFGVALLAPFPVTAQTLPSRVQSGYDTGYSVNCIGLDGVTQSRCLIPEQILVDQNGAPLGTASNPMITSGGGGGSSGVAQGSNTAGQTGPLVQAGVVTGNQTYTIGTTQPLNLTPSGRLKVGLSSTTNLAPAATPATTLESVLTGCIYRSAGATYTDQFSGAVACDVSGRLLTTGNDTITNSGFNALGSAGTAYQQGTGAAGANAQNVYIGGQNAAVAVSGSVTVSNFPASQAVTNAGTFAVQAAQSGSWTNTVTQATASALNATVVGNGTFAVQNTAPTPAGTNAIGSVTITNFPATQTVAGTVSANILTGTRSFTKTTATALAANTSIAAGYIDLGSATSIPDASANASVISSTTGTLSIFYSDDGSNGYVYAAYAVTAGTPLVVSVPIFARFLYATFLNGGTAAGAGVVTRLAVSTSQGK